MSVEVAPCENATSTREPLPAVGVLARPPQQFRLSAGPLTVARIEDQG